MTDGLELLDVGRHFRLAWDVKVVVGRNQGECRRIAGLAGEHDWIVEPAAGPGALALVQGRPDETRLIEAASLVAHYSGVRGAVTLDFTIRGPGAPRGVRAQDAGRVRVERWRV